MVSDRPGLWIYVLNCQRLYTVIGAPKCSMYILKLTDFGISKRTRSETFATYDDPNKIPFKWLPPEVLRSREMTPKADVWSYGVLIHELVRYR
ncbi:hypothetical protein OSTOST_08676 [Ostertagia ostertagi]